MVKNTMFINQVFGSKKKSFREDGTVYEESSLPADFKVLSSVSSTIKFDYPDRYEMAVIEYDQTVAVLILKNNNCYELYSKVKRILQDADIVIDKVYFTETNVLTHIYRNIYSVNDVVHKNENLESFNTIIDDAAKQNAANINILCLPNETTRITFEIYKQIVKYKTLESEKFLTLIKAFYVSIKESEKSPKEFNPQSYSDASSYHYLSVLNEAGLEVDKRVFRLRYHHCSAYDGGFDVTIRLNEVGTNIQSLARLGYDEYTLNFFDRLSKFDEGIVLWAGSTSSGKTTANASLLKLINDNSKQTKKNVSYEDPVEIIVPGTHPTSLFSSAGLATEDEKMKAWNKAMESCMRRAPHVVYVGEIRHSDVANACVRSALSGHLTLSTIHAHDPFQALNLLNSQFDVDLSTLLMPSVLRAIIAQKLVPILCPDCSYYLTEHENEISESDLNSLMSKFEGDISKLKVERHGAECQTCNGHGRIGLQPIYEIFTPKDKNTTQLLLVHKFIQAREAWKAIKTEDGITGVTFAHRAKELANEQKLCAIWTLNKVLEQ